MDKYPNIECSLERLGKKIQQENELAKKKAIETKEKDKLPLLRLSKLLDDSADYLLKNGYKYTYNESSSIVLTNISSGYYIRFFYGRTLTLKSLQRDTQLYGNVQSFNEDYVEGKGYGVSGKYDERDRDNIDTYIYYFGEDVDDALRFISKIVTSSEEHFYGRLYSSNRGYSPWCKPSIDLNPKEEKSTVNSPKTISNWRLLLFAISFIAIFILVFNLIKV